MSRRARRSLGRASASGVLAAGMNVPLTFQRTLMPRNTVDQALVTGLSITANQTLVTLLQETVDAGALLFARRVLRRPADDTTVRRVTLGLSGVTIGAGLLAQRAFRQQPGERLPHAAVRTGGFVVATAGTAGMMAGALEDTLVAKGGRRHALLVTLPVAGALAAVNDLAMRRRARLDCDLPPEDTGAATGRAFLFGIGVAGASSLFAAGERALADAVSRAIARVLPGEPEVWRPLGHAAALAGIAAAGQYATRQLFARIESREEAVELSFDIAPPTLMVSGHHDSLVPFSTLAMQGRRFVWMVTARDVIEQVTGDAAVAQPIRVYVGLQSAPTEAERVDLALQELERTGAFDRAWLMVVSPTGTGYVNYAAVSALEFLSRGDCATVAMQYSARPSPLSLGRVAEGRLHMALLLEGIRARLDQRPAGARPKVVLFGESLGAWTSQDPFVGRGTRGFDEKGIDHAIWIGTPHFSKWKEQVLHDDGPDIERDTVGVFNGIDDWRALDPAARNKVRYVMITHHDDGVAVFGPELLLQAPSWLGDPSSRPATVPKGMRWVPTTTFFQVLVDMKNAANVVPGVFAAKGHDYRADLLPFFDATLGFESAPELLESIRTWLETRELERSNWIKTHGTAEHSLSATIVDRLMQRERDEGRDADDKLLAMVRDVAAEEFAGGPRPSTFAALVAGSAGAGESGTGD